jgi:hypothetical protein
VLGQRAYAAAARRLAERIRAMPGTPGAAAALERLAPRPFVLA